MGILDDIKAISHKQEAPKPEPEAPTAPSGPKKVLIVEDEKMLADALAIKLKHEGLEVYAADNGQAGLDQAKAHHPDIILLDLMMPVMDGKTMLLYLRQIPEFKDTPVIILTNAGDIENIRETEVAYGVRTFLIKSNINPGDIVAQIKNQLNPPPSGT